MGTANPCTTGIPDARNASASEPELPCTTAGSPSQNGSSQSFCYLRSQTRLHCRSRRNPVYSPLARDTITPGVPQQAPAHRPGNPKVHTNNIESSRTTCWGPEHLYGRLREMALRESLQLEGGNPGNAQQSNSIERTNKTTFTVPAFFKNGLSPWVA